MDHITRCPHCHTAFRVSAEQLRAAAGQVRCGSCGEIFDAQAHLMAPNIPTLPLAARVPSQAAEDAAASQRPAEPAAMPEAPPEPVWPTLFGEPMELLWDSAPALGAATSIGAGPSTASAATAASPYGTEPTFAPSHGAPAAADAPLQGAPRPQPALTLNAEDGPADRVRTSQTAAAPLADGDLRADLATAPTAVTAVPLRAERQSPADSLDPNRQAAQPPRAAPGTRDGGWWLLALILALILLAQGAFWQHNWLAARWPASAPALRALCARLGCTVTPYQKLDALRLENSRLHAAPAHGGQYELGVTLRNQSDLTVATPSLELTLSDAERRVLVRRVLSPTELGAPPMLARDASVDLRRTLLVATQQLPGAIANYTLTAFYP